MKKTTKLLSVIIAVVMLMSCFTMAAYAAKTSYQTSANLTSLGAYSADGAATRFTTEERMSILFDWLDRVLAGVDFEGIHVSGSVPILGSYKLDVTINSVDEICASVDSLYDLLNSTVGGAATTLNLVGDLSDINIKNYWTKGSRRANKDQLNLVGQLLNILNGNVDLFENVLAKGSLSLGSIIGGQVDLSSINEILADLPGFILSKLYPLMSRKDDTKTVADQYYNGTGTPSTVLNTFVNNLFKNPQSTTTYKENASGTCISGHTLPTAASSNKRYYYVKTAAAGNTPAFFTAYVWDSEKQAYVAEDEKFYRTEESEGVYTYKTNAGDGLKYYKNGSYWLPSLQADLTKTNPVTININTESAAALLYKFGPYVFKDLAPIALNGWAKHTLATWMGATETKIYDGATVTSTGAITLDIPAEAKTFFTKAVPYYQFSYSDYLAYSDDVQYYRWVDKDTNTEEWYELDMTTGNYYLGLFNFGYTVGGDFMNEFVPASGTATGTLFQNLNKFLCKAAKTVLKTDVYNSLGLEDTGDNTKIVPNLRKAVSALLPEAPEAILGPDYLLHYDGYYQTLVSTSASDDEVFSALAAIIAKALMPQLILPSAEKLEGQKVGAVLACVVRELVTQFVPTYNYDALIFSDYNTRTLVSGKDNSYWLDVILTMGVDVGVSYLSNLADVGRELTTGLQVAASKTYTLSAFEANPQAWEASVDWIIDWALTSSVEWGWNMEKLINISSFTGNNAVDLSKVGDPWVKLDTILNDLLPLKQIINCTKRDDNTTWLETVLRDKLILGIADLKFEYIFGKGTNYTTSGNAGLLSIPSNSILRTSGAVPALWQIVRDLLNKVIYKVAGNANILDTSVFTGIDTLVGKSTFKPGSTSYSNCPNIVRPISFLLRKLPSAYTNVFAVVLPILEMFVGWKTSSQEYADPEITWSAPYLYKTSSDNNGISLTIKNSSAGMLLKLIKGSTVSYEKAYDIVIDGISGTGLTSDWTNNATNNTIAPWAEKTYTIKASSVPSADTAVQLTISYHVVGKTGAAIGGTRYLSTYLVVSKNISDIDATQNKQYDKTGSSGTNTVDAIDLDFDGVNNVLCLSRDDLEFTIENGIWYRLKNYSGDYTCAVSGSGFTIGNTLFFDTNEAIANGTIAKAGEDGEEVTYHPVKIKSGKTVDDFVTGTAYAIGTVKYTLKSSNNNETLTESGLSLGSLYFADAGDLLKVYNEELAKNRVASQYSNATHFNTYVTAMKNAAVLLTGPAMVSSFATNFVQSNIDAKIDAIKDAVEVIDEEKLENTDVVGILSDGLAATEVDGFIGADGQINFQDYTLYNYWLYEKNRTEARDIMKQYEGPVEPKAYIEGCWLPYDGSDKNEDLVSVLAAEANATKAAAITDSMTAPSAADIAAYNIAMADWKAPEYSELYAADIAQKLSLYKQFLTDRTYSKVAAGRAQLAQEIAYAAAQNYNEADYTAKSWARYTDALAKANAANANGTMQSFVFQAKYDLLVAQRQLRLAAHDYETQVGYTGLQALVDLAEGMFANAAYFEAVDGTLDTEWTDLIVALGYDAQFSDWSMNLYDKSATQLISEELYYPSVRNEERVEDVTAALQAAIDALECTIKVVENDATTVVDQDIKYITNLVPGSLTNTAAVLAHVRASSTAADLAVTATANGFGTGTIVAATLSGIPLANYYVVIFGDINGDNAIDGFDAVKADRRLITGTAFVNAPQEKAADATHDGSFGIADVGAIINAAAGLGDIAQD